MRFSLWTNIILIVIYVSVVTQKFQQQHDSITIRYRNTYTCIYVYIVIVTMSLVIFPIFSHLDRNNNFAVLLIIQSHVRRVEIQMNLDAILSAEKILAENKHGRSPSVSHRSVRKWIFDPRNFFATKNDDSPTDRASNLFIDLVKTDLVKFTIPESRDLIRLLRIDRIIHNIANIRCCIILSERSIGNIFL